MPRPRSVAIVLSAVALAGPSAAFGQGSGGAGDDQYQDPIGAGSPRKSPSAGSPTTKASSGPALSQDPNLGGGDTAGSSSSTPATQTGTGAGTGAATGVVSGAALPNTGSDPRQIILAGLALLLSGLGLRLRTADEIF